MRVWVWARSTGLVRLQGRCHGCRWVQTAMRSQLAMTGHGRRRKGWWEVHGCNDGFFVKLGMGMCEGCRMRATEIGGSGMEFWASE